jgi:hypothetical protein
MKKYMKNKYFLISCLLVLIVSGCGKNLKPEPPDLCSRLSPPVYTEGDADVISDPLAKWLDSTDETLRLACPKLYN